MAFVSCFAVLLVASHRGRSVMRSSCGVAACFASSFAYRLGRLLVSRSDGRLVARSPCPAWLMARRAHLVVLARLVVSFSSVSVGRAVLPVSGGVSSPPSRRAGRGWLLVLSWWERMGGGSRLVSSVSGAVPACLRCRREVRQCRSRHRRSRLFPVVSLWLCGSVFVQRFRSACRRLLSAIALSSYRLDRLETAGRETGQRPAWLSGRGSSGLVGECI